MTDGMLYVYAVGNNTDLFQKLSCLVSTHFGSGLCPAAASVDGNLVEPVDTFVYLSSLQSFDGCC